MTARHRKPTRGPFERVRRFFGFGPEFDPDSTATQRIEDGTTALLNRAEGLGINTPRRDPDAIMGLIDHEVVTPDEAQAAYQERLAAAKADLEAQTHGRATASGQWDRHRRAENLGKLMGMSDEEIARRTANIERAAAGEARRRDTLGRMKQNRGYSADQKSNAAHHNEDTFRGVGEYNDPSSPYTDPTQ